MNQYTSMNQVPWWNRDGYAAQSRQQMQQPQQQPMNYAASYRPQGLLGSSNSKNPGTLGAEMYTNYVNNLLMQNAPQVAPPQQQGVFNFNEPRRLSWRERQEDYGGGSA